MQLETPEIAWHSEKQKCRIMSIDFHPFQNSFITSGEDEQFEDDSQTIEFKGYIKYWEILSLQQKQEQQEKWSVKFIRGLDGNSAHYKPVNCVRFSPNGQYFASGSDDKKIVIWNYGEGIVNFKRMVTWLPCKSLIGHQAEIYDLRWSNDSNYIVSSGMDNRVILWSVEKSMYIQVFDNHKNVVLGVSYCPTMEYILTQGQDKQVKLWRRLKSKKSDIVPSYIISNNLRKIDYKVSQSEQQQPSKDNAKQTQLNTASNNDGAIISTNPNNNNASNNNNKNCNQMQEEVNSNENSEVEDDDMSVTQISSIQQRKSYCCFLDYYQFSSLVKRPDWSPDGQFFILPSALYLEYKDSKQEPCAFLYRKCNISVPSLVISTNNKPSVCVRFCPKLFKKKKEGQFSMLDLPYVIIFAIATTDTVLIYSTAQLQPLAIVGNIHFAGLTDMSWNGSRQLAISSQDGYCSFIHFENGILGQEYTKQEIEVIDPKLAEMVYKTPYYNQDDIASSNKKLSQKPLQVQVPSQVSQIVITRKTDGQERKQIIPIMIKKL